MGVEIFCSRKPLGRTRSSRTLPTGSGSAATSRKPFAMPAMRLSSSFRRSSMADVSPICAPASMSFALADLMASEFFSNASAIARRQRFFSSVVSLASSRDAALACLASAVICSVNVMRRNLRERRKQAKVRSSRGKLRFEVAQAEQRALEKSWKRERPDNRSGLFTQRCT